MFDHQKALDGAPIYQNGNRIYPVYDPVQKTWNVHFGHAGNSWLRDGCAIGSAIASILSTDPPMVEVTRWMWVAPGDKFNSVIYTSSSEAILGEPRKNGEWRLISFKMFVLADSLSNNN